MPPPPPAMNDESDGSDGRPITTGSLIRWGGAGLLVCTTLVSIVWFCASVKQDVALTQQQLSNHMLDESDKRASRDKEIAEIRERINKQDTGIDDMKEKMTRALTILERLDKTGGRP